MIRTALFYLLPILVLFFNAGKASAQNTQYDTARLDIGSGKALPSTNLKPDAQTRINENDGVGLTASSAILYSFHPLIRDSLSKNGIFMPTFTMYFGKHYAPFVEISGSMTKDNRGFALNLFQFSAGLVNQVALTERLNFRQKYAMSVLSVATENPKLTKYFGVGFMAGLGLQTLVADKFHLYVDANYMYQARQFSGIRFEPGIIMQF